MNKVLSTIYNIIEQKQLGKIGLETNVLITGSVKLQTRLECWNAD